MSLLSTSVPKPVSEVCLAVLEDSSSDLSLTYFGKDELSLRSVCFSKFRKQARSTDIDGGCDSGINSDIKKKKKKANLASLSFSLVLAQDFVSRRFRSPNFSAFTITFMFDVSLHFHSIKNVPITTKRKNSNRTRSVFSDVEVKT